MTSADCRRSQMSSRRSPAASSRSASDNPQHGPRNSASQAVRSARWHKARVSASRSRIAGLSASRSISTARNAVPAALSATVISARCVRLRTSTAMLAWGSSLRSCLTMSATASASARASPAGAATHLIASPGRASCHGTEDANGTAPSDRSARGGKIAGNAADTHSTRPAWLRKFTSSRRVSSGRSPMPEACAFRKRPTSASRKR